MPVTMLCPNLKCGRTVVASDGCRGKPVRCAHCQTTFLVPANAPEKKPPAAAPEESAAEQGKKA